MARGRGGGRGGEGSCILYYLCVRRRAFPRRCNNDISNAFSAHIKYTFFVLRAVRHLHPISVKRHSAGVGEAHTFFTFMGRIGPNSACALSIRFATERLKPAVKGRERTVDIIHIYIFKCVYIYTHANVHKSCMCFQNRTGCMFKIEMCILCFFFQFRIVK